MSTGSFKNKFAALSWIQGQGVKIGKTKFYNGAGRLYPVNPDGSVPFEGVKQFAENLGAKFDGEVSEAAAVEQEEKIRGLRLKNARSQFEFDRDRGKYLPRADLESELAARAIILDQGLRQIVQNDVLEIIHLVGGDPEKSRDLQEWLNDRLNTAMNEYATTRTFQVMVLPEDAA